MKKFIATFCIIAASSLTLAACADRTQDTTGPGYAQTRTAGDNDVSYTPAVRTERTFSRAQSK